MDLVGVALVSLALLLFVWPLGTGRQAGCRCGPGVALASAVPGRPPSGGGSTGSRAPTRASDTGDAVPQPSFTVGLLAALTTFAAFTDSILVFTLYLQEGLGYGPLAAGRRPYPSPSPP